MISFSMLSLGKENRLDGAWAKFKNSGNAYLLQFVQILFSGLHISIYIDNNILYNILLFIDKFLVTTDGIFFKVRKSQGIFRFVES